MAKQRKREARAARHDKLYTSNLADRFAPPNLSLVVSIYQAGQVSLVRHNGAPASSNGWPGTINIHFRNFSKPMSVAVPGNHLAIGAKSTVWELRNLPAGPCKLGPPGKHDARYLRRRNP